MRQTYPPSEWQGRFLLSHIEHVCVRQDVTSVDYIPYIVTSGEIGLQVVQSQLTLNSPEGQ